MVEKIAICVCCLGLLQPLYTEVTVLISLSPSGINAALLSSKHTGAHCSQDLHLCASFKKGG